VKALYLHDDADGFGRVTNVSIPMTLKEMVSSQPPAP
jgi:hypothetical protein